MPIVKGKKYPYTKTGKAAAGKARKKPATTRVARSIKGKKTKGGVKASAKKAVTTANKKLKAAGLKLDNSGKKVARLPANERLAYAKALGAQRAAPKKVAGQAARRKRKADSTSKGRRSSIGGGIGSDGWRPSSRGGQAARRKKKKTPSKLHR